METQIERIEEEHQRYPLIDRITKVPGFQRSKPIPTADGVKCVLKDLGSSKYYLLNLEELPEIDGYEPLLDRQG